MLRQRPGHFKRPRNFKYIYNFQAFELAYDSMANGDFDSESDQFNPKYDLSSSRILQLIASSKNICI